MSSEVIIPEQERKDEAMTELDRKEQEELESQLKEAGNRLTNPPASVEELLLLLDEIENYLARVEQSPPSSMQDALEPSMKALVSDELLEHLDTDVKVAVASCVSEITRITAPEAPYDDDKMKDIFQLIVGAFEELYDMGSRSYNKRVSILETVAKVRSCVVMLDLECDGLILEMFQHFLKSLRDSHPEKVFSSMETIMSLVLEESEEISPELLSPLLASVKKDNQDVLPIATALGEKVLESCTTKLKPMLLEAVKSMGISPTDYSKIVGIICEVTSDAVGHEDVSAQPEDILVVEEIEPAVSCPREVDPVMDQLEKNVMSNGDAETEKVGSLVAVDSSETEPELKPDTVQPADVEPDSLDSNIVQSETKPDQPTKRKRGRKPKSSVHTPEPSGVSHIDNDKETPELLDKGKGHGKDADDPPEGNETLLQLTSPSASRDEPVKITSPPQNQSFPDTPRSKRGRPAKAKKVNATEDTDHASHLAANESEGPSSTDTIMKKGAEGNSEIEDKSQKHSGKEALENGEEDDVALIQDAGVTSDSDAKPLKRSRKKVIAKHGKGSVDDGSSAKDAGATSDPETKPLNENEPTEVAGVTSNPETKPSKRSHKKKVYTKDGNDDNVTQTKDASAANDSEKKPRLAKKVTGKDGNEDNMTPIKNASDPSDAETKPLKRSHKKKVFPDDVYVDGSSERKQGGKGKKGKGTHTTKSDVAGESSNTKMVSSSKSKAKSTPKNQKSLDETPKTTSKRKRTSGKAETSIEDVDGSLVGSKIKVWWPEDQAFYSGVVESFDSIEKKHKVLYDDGDEEILVLKEERWEIVDPTENGEEPTDLPSPNASESHQKKKAKTSLESSRKQAKTDTSSKRGKGSSTSKSKDEEMKTKDDDKISKTPKSKNDNDGKSKSDTTKSSNKAKVDTPKAGTKSKDDTPKVGTKSKDDTPKTATKSKDETPKKGAKSKGDTPKTGSKSKEEAPKAATKDETPKSSTKSKSAASKSGSKSKVNGSTAKPKPDAPEIEESEDSAKGKASGSAAKAQDIESKGSSKRKRKTVA